MCGKTWYLYSNASRIQEVQNLIVLALESLVNVYLGEATDRQREKFVKAYCEPIALLEKTLLKQRNLDINSTTVMDFKEHSRLKEEVIRILLSEVNRQARHYMTFLTTVSIADDEFSYTGDDYKKWCSNGLSYKVVEEKVQQALEILIKKYFSRSNDYAREKFVKSFIEGFIYLEGLLERKYGIDYDRLLEERTTEAIQDWNEYLKGVRRRTRGYDEMISTLLKEVERKTEQFDIFLQAVAERNKRCRTSLKAGVVNA